MLDKNNKQHDHKWLTVIGGTGFLGGAICRYAQSQRLNVRVVSRHPPTDDFPLAMSIQEQQQSANALRFEHLDLTRCISIKASTASPLSAKPNLELYNELLHEKCTAALRDIATTSFAVVNCASLWDAPTEDLLNLHVNAAEAVAGACAEASGCRLVHMSGLAADAERTDDDYLRVRGIGDAVCLGSGPADDTFILRPGAIIGEDGRRRGLLPRFLQLAKMRVAPLFGFGATPMQPITREDLARLAVQVATSPEPLLGAKNNNNNNKNKNNSQKTKTSAVINCTGTEVLTFKQVLGEVADAIGVRAYVTLPLPFALWDRVVVPVCEFFAPWSGGAPMVTHAQVKLLQNGDGLTDTSAKISSVKYVRRNADSVRAVECAAPVVSATDVAKFEFADIRAAIRTSLKDVVW